MTIKKSIRAVEAELRAAGMTAAAAKQQAANWQTLQGKPMSTNTTLARAFERFAPSFRYIAEIANTANANYTVTNLQKARAAITDGIDSTDPTDWEARIKLADSAVAELDRMIAGKRAEQAASARTARPVAGQEVSGSFGASGGAPVFREVGTGRMLRTYRHDEPVAGDGGQPDWGVGDMVRAAVTGDWARLPSHTRAGAAGIGAAGGFLIPSELSAYVLDLARAKARVLQAGAITMPMTHGNLTVAVVTSDPQASWKAENASFAVSQGGYGAINLVTRTLGVIVPLSLELVMSASNINEVVTAQLTQALGLQLDIAAISADGTQNQPRGIVPQLPSGQIVNASGVTASGGYYPCWSKAIGAVLGANADLDRLSILHNSDVDVTLDSLQDSLSQPMRAPSNYSRIQNAGRVLIANGIATSGSPSASYSLVGDFSQVLFGMQQSLSIEISREGSYDAAGQWGNAFAQGQVLIRALIMCDIAVLRPTFFAQVQGIPVFSDAVTVPVI